MEEEKNDYIVKYTVSTLRGGDGQFIRYKKHPSRIIPLDDAPDLPNLPEGIQKEVDEKLSAQIMDGKKLSDIQMESILYCHARHQAALYRGETRHAFLLGDSTGTGKGRQIAGLLILNILSNRPGPHFWFSKDKNLLDDAKKALTDVSIKHRIMSKGSSPSTEPVIYLYKYGDYDGSQEITNGNGLIYFMTYGNAKDNQISDIIMDANNENRVIVFDECHATNGNGKWAKTVKTLTDGIPKARILYASATPFNGVNNLSYLQRIMLDVDLRAIKSENDKNEILRCHLITRWLRAKGYYVARTIDPETSTYRVQELPMNMLMVEQYRLMSYLYYRLLVAYNPLKTKDKEKTVGKEFWTSVNNGFFSPIIANFKVDGVINLVETEGRGIKCLIVFSNTNEGSMDKAEYPGSLTNVKFRNMLSIAPLGRNDFNIWFPYIHPILNPLDQYLYIFDDKVTLVSSKTTQYQFRGDDSIEIVKVESSKAKIFKDEAITNFNDDTNDILLMGKSLSTGASLHRNSNPEKQRLMILTQFNEYIEEFLQTIGRVQRTSSVTDGTKIATIVSAILPIASEYIKLNATHNKLRVLSSSRGSYNPQEFIDLLGDNKDDYYIQKSAFKRIMSIYNETAPLDSNEKECILKGYTESIPILRMECESQEFIESMVGTRCTYLDPGKQTLNPGMESDKVIDFCTKAIKEIIAIISFKTDGMTLDQFLGRLIMLPFGYQNLIFNIFKQFIQLDPVKTGDMSITPIPWGGTMLEEVFTGKDRITKLVRYTLIPTHGGNIRYMYGGEFWMYYKKINDYSWTTYQVGDRGVFNGLTTRADASNKTSKSFKESIEDEYIKLFVNHNDTYLKDRYVRTKEKGLTTLYQTNGYPLSFMIYRYGSASLTYCKEKDSYRVIKDQNTTYYPDSTIVGVHDKYVEPTVAIVKVPEPSTNIRYKFESLTKGLKDQVLMSCKCDDVLTLTTGKIEYGIVTQMVV